MILADTTYAGQLNMSDQFTRMVLSLVATGIAPGSFYELDADGNRQRVHFDGLPVEFVAEAIATLGAQVVDGFQTYHVMNPHDDGIGLDEYVDWLIEAGHPIQRIGDFGEWLQRFETEIFSRPNSFVERWMIPGQDPGLDPIPQAGTPATLRPSEWVAGRRVVGETPDRYRGRLDLPGERRTPDARRDRQRSRRHLALPP
jgi:hypothetical protein